MSKQRFFQFQGFPDYPDRSSRTGVGPGSVSCGTQEGPGPFRGRPPVVPQLTTRTGPTSRPGKKGTSSPGTQRIKKAPPDPRRHWVFYPPSDAEVAAVEAAEKLAAEAAAKSSRKKPTTNPPA